MNEQRPESFPGRGTIDAFSKRINSALKNLRLEDLQAPNQVLCYGAGTVAKYAIESYLCAGMNVVGFIDQNKKGTVDTSQGPLPVCTIDAAVSTFGKGICVIVTIANRSIYEQVRENLIAAGISAERIFDWQISSWLTVPSPKCWCPDLFHSVRLAHNAIMKCCMWGENRNFNMEMLEPGVPYAQSLQNCVDKMEHYYERALAGEVPLYCAGCPFLEDRRPDGPHKIQDVFFAASTHCNLECIYCYSTEMREGAAEFPYSPKQYGELFRSMLQFFDQKGLLAPDARIGYAGGEISVSPAKSELLSFAVDHAGYKYLFFSNCVVYSEEIAQILSRNTWNTLMCDLDAGTRESYMLVKGYDYFDRVVENLKKYAQNGRVVLKYIVLPGYNTSLEDYLGTVRLLKELNIDELLLSQNYMLSLDLYEERKVLFEVARFRNILAENGIHGEISDTRREISGESFSKRQRQIMDRFYRKTV